MKKTVCELFAGVGGFRCGLNSIKSIEDTEKPEKWETVWFNQWEPIDKKIQWAHACYVNRFGFCKDLEGHDTTNDDINTVNKITVPDHNLLVGGFPCQDYSVASSLSTSKGLEGKKGVLWWDIRDMLEVKKAPFVLLENVDRLIKSPAKQRGRDFAIILACFRDLGYTVEWRVINAAEYGYQQRRRRTFIFAYKNDTVYASRIALETQYSSLCREEMRKESMSRLIHSNGFFAKSFPVALSDDKNVRIKELSEEIGRLSSTFSFTFENSGVMKDDIIYTVKTVPIYEGRQITLGDIMEEGDVDRSFFVPKERLYYTSPDSDHSDETQKPLSNEERKTWQYIKGAKKLLRRSKNGHEYVFSEGPIAMVDEYDKPARTMLTSEGSFNRTTHIVRDKKTKEIRLLTPIEVERIQGFPSDWTKECLVNGETVEMPVNKRRFMMGNALVVNLVNKMEKQLSDIFDAERQEIISDEAQNKNRRTTAMRLKNILLVVSDIERARRFYQEVFGLCVLRDFGENVMLTEGVVLQEKKSWEQLIGTDTVTGNASELFFEENNFDEFLQYLEEHPEVQKAGAVRVNSWGKRVLMLKDPDGHLIEVAER